MSNVTSYGGLTRTAGNYTTLQGVLTSSVGALTLNKMATQVSNQSHGNRGPDLILCTKAVWNFFEALITPVNQLTITQKELAGYPQFISTGAIVAAGTQLKGAQGFNSLSFRGIPVVADERCPANQMFLLNKDSIAFYGLKSTDPDYKPVSFGGGAIEGVYSSVPSVTGFAFSGFNTPIDQYGKVGHIILMGNLLCEDPRINGYMTGITS